MDISEYLKASAVYKSRYIIIGKGTLQSAINPTIWSLAVCKAQKYSPISASVSLGQMILIGGENFCVHMYNSGVASS